MLKYNDKLQVYSLDRRLFVLVILEKWKMLLLSFLIGGVLGVVLYYVQEVEILTKLEYEATEIFYVEYNQKPNGEIYYAYNDVGWSYVMMFDEIVETALGNLPFHMTKEELNQLVSSDNKGDYKILSVTVTSSKKEECIPILEAFVPAMELYGENSMHIEYIKLASEPTTPQLILVTNETWRALLGGSVLGVVVGLLVMGFYVMSADVFYVPNTLESLYSIPIVSVQLKDGRWWREKEYEEVWRKSIKGEQVITISCEESLENEKIKQYGKAVIEVVVGKTTYGSIQRMIQYGKVMDINIVGFRFVQGNRWILRQYYR